jgi:hypothetical protein
MDGNDFIALLGLTWEDKDVQRFLAEFGVAKKKPKIDPDSLAGYLVIKKSGLEIAFKDEHDVTFRRTDYDEGDLVLANIRMYGDGNTKGYAPFEGELPHELKKEFGLKEVQARLGKASATNKSIALGRWDFEGYCLAIIFDQNHKHIRQIAVQLPVDVK